MIPALLIPRSAGELLDAAIIMGRRHYLPLLRLAALPYGLSVVIELLGETKGAAPGLGFLVFVGTLVLSSLTEGAAIVACADVVHGRPIGTTDHWAQVRRNAFPIVVGYTLKWILAILGLFLLLVPGAYLLCLYFAIPTVSAIEGLGLRRARRRSRDLARAHLGRVFATVGIFDLALMVAGATVTYLGGGWNASGTSPMATLLNWLLSLLLLPIRCSLVTLVYYDCRIRSEAYDLEQAATP